jgi:hypothetical protein
MKLLTDEAYYQSSPAFLGSGQKHGFVPGKFHYHAVNRGIFLLFFFLFQDPQFDAIASFVVAAQDSVEKFY